MSEKTSTDDITPDSARLTRRQVQQNPELKSQLSESLKDNTFKRSAKTPRSPPGKTQKEEDKNVRKPSNTNKTLGAIPKNPAVVGTKIQKSTEIITKERIKQTELKADTREDNQETSINQEKVIEINAEQREKFDNSNNISEREGPTFQANLSFFQSGNDSILDKTFEFGKEGRYTDFGGILAEESLVVGTKKDPQFNLTKYSNLSTNFSPNTGINGGGSLIDLDSPWKFENTRNSRNRGGNLNQEQGNNANMAPPLKLNLKDVANFVPEYNGKNMTAAEYIKKLKQVRSLVDTVDEGNLTNLLKVRMTGEAEEALSGNEIKTIDDLIMGVRTLYPMDDDIHELMFKMRRIIQGESETVVQYTNRLRKIVLKIKELKKQEGLPAEDLPRFNTDLYAEAANKYKKGLKSEIKYELGAENTVEDISRAAIEIESDIRKRKEISNAMVSNTYEDYGRKVEQPQRVLTCQICKDFQHEALFCRSAACVYCKGADHFSNNCMNAKNKIKLICKFCSQPGHSISACRFNKKQNNHCQYCQEMGHDVGQCPYISDYEICWKCKEAGHNPHRCVNIMTNNVEKCEYCDTMGHTVQNCPDVVCKKCNKKGHTIKYCKAGEVRSNFRICTICETIGHEEAECERARILVAEYKAKQQFKCQICEETGHTAKFCNKFRNKQQTHQNISNNYNRGFQRKFCEYCKMAGHIVSECRKLMALENRGKSKQEFCQYCNKSGHKIDYCEKIKRLQSEQEEFCTICKNIDHTAEKCFRNKNKQENYNTLPGGNA